MASTTTRRASKTILIDIGGVLMAEYLPAAAVEWSARLGISERSFLGALFGGNDDQVLVGRVSEPWWWSVVGERLQADPDLIAELRCDLASRESWDGALVAYLRRLRGHALTAVVSNTWPGMRTRMSEAGLLDIADEIVLSCEAGYAKPDARIYTTALQRLGAEPGDALFIDDTEIYVAAAQTLGMTGHLHANTADTIARIERFLVSSARSGAAGIPGSAG
jgi:putative hydrolase of the HAD superfamily